MKYLILLVFAFLMWSGTTAAKSSSNFETVETPRDFKSDNCTFFPDGDYADCCVEHDKAYFAGGSWKKRWKADKKLFQCVTAKGRFCHKIIAPVMWLGVRIGGVSWLPTSFRWGFGKARKTKKASPIRTPRRMFCRPSVD